MWLVGGDNRLEQGMENEAIDAASGKGGGGS